MTMTDDEKFIEYILHRPRWEAFRGCNNDVRRLINLPHRGYYNKAWANVWADIFLIANQVLNSEQVRPVKGI